MKISANNHSEFDSSLNESNTMPKHSKKPFYQRNMFWVLISMAFVFSVCASLIPNRIGTSDASDEFAEFAIAAYVYGYDWSAVVRQLGYFSFGYPIIFILPLFWIFDGNTLLIFKAALVLNSLMISMIIPLGYYLIKKWCNSLLPRKILWVPFLLALALSSHAVTYSQIGYAESLLILLGFVVVALINKIQEPNISFFWFALTGFVFVYGFYVHQRFLGVALSGVLVLILMFISKRINIKKMISFLSGALVVLIPSMWFKRFIQSELWNFKDTGLLGADTGNDIAARVKSFTDIFSLDGFSGFITALCGQFWYLSFSTLLLPLMGLIIFFWCFYTKIRNNKAKIFNDFVGIFIVLAFLSTLVISATAMHGLSRQDAFFYGRYNDIMLHVFALYSLILIINNVRDKMMKAFALSVALFIALSITVVFIFSMQLTELTILFVQIPALRGAYPHFIVISILTLSFAALLYQGLKGRKYILSSLALVVLLTYTVVSGRMVVKKDLLPNDHGYNSFGNIASIISEEISAGLPFYDKSFEYASWLYTPRIQMRFPQHKVFLTHDISNAVGQPYFISLKNAAFDKEILKAGLSIKATDGRYVLFESLPENTGESDIPIEYFSTQVGVINKGVVASNGKKGALIYGPYCRLEAGHYIFTARCNLLNDNPPEEVGYGDIFSYEQNKVFMRTEITKKQFVDDYYDIVIDFIIEDPIEDFEFRIFVNEGVSLEVSNISINLLSEGEAIPDKQSDNQLAALDINKQFTHIGVRDSGVLTSNGTKGYLMYGPYRRLAPGKYVFTAECELLSNTEAPDSVGWSDIAYNKGETRLSRINIEKTDFNHGLITISIAVDVVEEIPDYEFRLYVNENAILRINSINVQLEGAE